MNIPLKCSVTNQFRLKDQNNIQLIKFIHYFYAKRIIILVDLNQIEIYTLDDLDKLKS